MKRTVWITLLAVVAFLAIVIARLPANWVLPSSGSISCSAVDGTLWSATCTGLTVQGKPVGDVIWDLHPGRLLAGKLAGHVNLTRPDGSLTTDVEAGLNKSVTARNLVADVPLDPAVIPNFPRTLRGSAHLDLPLLQVDSQGNITQVQGRVEAHDLEDRSNGHLTKLGGYSVSFPAGGTGEPTGQLHDLGDGPLSVEGTLKLVHGPGMQLDSWIRARPGAPEELTDMIQILGSPDAQGRREFSMESTF